MIFKLVTASVVCLGTIHSFAQDSANPNAKQSQVGHKVHTTSKPQQQSAVVDDGSADFANVPFDDTQGTLPKNFNGIDIEKLAGAIKDSTKLASKSEFETTSAYETRLMSFKYAPLFSGVIPELTPIAVVASQSEYPSMSNLSVTYDADSAEFTIRLGFNNKSLYLMEGHPTMAVLSTQTKLRESKDYMASNAMGATVQVHETYLQSYGLAIDPDSWLMAHKESQSASLLNRNQPSFKLGVPADIAQNLKPQVSALIEGKMSSPWIAQDIFSHDPTIDDPSKILEGFTFLVFRPMAVIIFRKDTGEILKRITRTP